MDSIKLEAEIFFEERNGSPTVSLVLKTSDEQVAKVLDDMAWGRLPEIDGLRYCRINSVCPHSIGGLGDGSVGLVMTVNRNPWNGDHLPSRQT